MPIFHMPVIFTIDADTAEEAQNALLEWQDEIDMNELPIGTEDMDCAPETENNDEGQRVLYLPLDEETDFETDDDDNDEKDDFNEEDEDP